MSPDRQLDPEALGDHIDRLYRAARSMTRSREEAEDLVQETFARVLRKPRMLRSEDDIGYLLRVLRNTYVSTRRTQARRPQTTALPDDLDLVEDRESTRPDARLEHEDLYAAISSLPDDFRDALVAIDVVGLSYREASTNASGPGGDDHHTAAPREAASREGAERRPKPPKSARRKTRKPRAGGGRTPVAAPVRRRPRARTCGSRGAT